jgi:hypothetical protein
MRAALKCSVSAPYLSLFFEILNIVQIFVFFAFCVLWKLLRCVLKQLKTLFHYM